jgi:hypothetical protein
MASRSYGLDSSLWLLFRLTAIRDLEKFLTHLVSIPGVITLCLSICFFCGFSTPVSEKDLSTFHSVGGYVLFFAILLLARFGLDGRTIHFSQEQNQFLMSSPLIDKKIILFRLLESLLHNFYLAVFFSLLVGVFNTPRLEAFFKIYPVLCLTQLVPLTLNSLVQRKNVKYVKLASAIIDLILPILFALGSLWLAGFVFHVELLTSTALGFLGRLRLALSPLFLVTDAFLTQGIDNSTICFISGLSFCLICVGIVINFLDIRDDRFIECGERAIQRSERQFQNGSILQTKWKPKSMLPDFPKWGGIGPVFWKKANEYSQNIFLLMIFIGIVVCTHGFNVFILSKGWSLKKVDFSTIQLWETLFTGLMFSIFVTTTDFRADISKLEYLKSLPLRSARVVVGQTLMSTICIFSLIAFSSVLDGVVYVHYFPNSPIPIAPFQTAPLGLPIGALFSTVFSAINLFFPHSTIGKRSSVTLLNGILSSIGTYLLFGFIGWAVVFSGSLDKSYGSTGAISILLPMLSVSLLSYAGFVLATKAYDRFDVSGV